MNFKKLNTVKLLIILNISIFVIQIIALNFSMDQYNHGIMEYLFALWPGLIVDKLFIWQLFTYQFLHGGILHLFFNMWVLWMFGNELEEVWGKNEFLKYYLFSGTGAGIIIFMVNYFLLDQLNPTLGASGAILGLLLAYAMYWPERTIIIWFVIPVKVKYIVLVIGLISILSSIDPRDRSMISHVGHLGGMVAGYLYLRFYRGKKVFGLMGYGNVSTGTAIFNFLKRFRKDNFNKKKDIFRYTNKEQREQKVDELLEKITKNGIHSLTKSEREFLLEASRKMSDNKKR